MEPRRSVVAAGLLEHVGLGDRCAHRPPALGRPTPPRPRWSRWAAATNGGGRPGRRVAGRGLPRGRGGLRVLLHQPPRPLRGHVPPRPLPRRRPGGRGRAGHRGADALSGQGRHRRRHFRGPEIPLVATAAWCPVQGFTALLAQPRPPARPRRPPRRPADDPSAVHRRHRACRPDGHLWLAPHRLRSHMPPSRDEQAGQDEGDVTERAQLRRIPAEYAPKVALGRGNRAVVIGHRLVTHAAERAGIDPHQLTSCGASAQLRRAVAAHASTGEHGSPLSRTRRECARRERSPGRAGRARPPTSPPMGSPATASTPWAKPTSCRTEGSWPAGHRRACWTAGAVGTVARRGPRDAS